jgi:hypothetical protein
MTLEKFWRVALTIRTIRRFAFDIADVLGQVFASDHLTDG